VTLSDGRYIRVNDAFCEITGYSRDELLHMRFADLTHPLDLEEDLRQFARLIAGEIPSGSLEKRYIRKGGSIIWVQLTVTLIKDVSGAAVSELGLVIDITDRKQAEEELRRLAARLLQSQDEERRRIARELHDETAQNLLAVNLNLNHLLRSHAAPEDPVRSLILETIALGESALGEIRTLSYLLHPPLLDQVGLKTALEWFVDGFSKRSGIDVELLIPQELRRLPSEVETSLFRVVQEALANVHRHSGSEWASIRLTNGANQVVLEVEDRGSGLATEGSGASEDLSSLGVGVPGMRHRMRQHGGDLTISTSRDGTTVTVVVPLEGLKS
jgi:PAS domain S-box-containing protein